MRWLTIAPFKPRSLLVACITTHLPFVILVYIENVQWRIPGMKIGLEKRAADPTSLRVGLEKDFFSQH